MAQVIEICSDKVKAFYLVFNHQWLFLLGQPVLDQRLRDVFSWADQQTAQAANDIAGVEPEGYIQ